MTANPVSYIEIPANDLDRAIAFYSAVFGFELERATIDGYEMALFPHAEGKPGASGALVKGDVYEPSKAGAIVYLSVADIDRALTLAAENGAQVLYSKKDIGDQGFVAEIEDSEGNRIALHQSIAT
ncbi:VOC family protein [Roseitalea porphyridii]|uniref:VOC family protein n=1 Tax=Roseitalea porphyridii TaxID=1852022 RepID=A0A4P6UYQ4_9HYPH|nr:VOC family protein [Roseitalea porphyridii]QBK30152.1 VOC family protein [Roseitalea porphyridii]